MSRYRPRSSPPAVVAAAALVGAATGLRSQMGLAAVVLRTDPAGLPPALRGRPARRAVAAAAIGELAADLYPAAPDRTAPAGLAARLVFGALAGGLIGRSRGTGVVTEAVVAAGVAAATAFGGLALRSRLSRRYPPVGLALAEDALAAGLALVGCMTLPTR